MACNNQGAVNENCRTEQSFCTVNGQTVLNNSGISATLSNIVQQDTKISDTIWNRIHTVLRNIYNYGLLGTRNPNINNLKDVQDNDAILLSLYNDILTRININRTSGNPKITKEIMDNLQRDINTYRLNNNRCNSCNTACNTSCQAKSQYSGGGGGGSCDGCMCYFQGGQGGAYNGTQCNTERTCNQNPTQARQTEARNNPFAARCTNQSGSCGQSSSSSSSSSSSCGSTSYYKY